MQFNLDKSLEILERTPDVMISLLSGVSAEWTMHNEGGESWSPFDVMGHLVHGEKTDWMDRIQICLQEEGDKIFKPFDRFAQFTDSKDKALNNLLSEFKELRTKNIRNLESLNLKANDFDKTAMHPSLGEVKLSQLISTWAVHDLGHIGQIVRVMAKQYKEETGPWVEYLRVLKD